MASRKRDTYQIEPRTYALFRLCLNWMTINGKWKILKKLVMKEMLSAETFPSI